MSAPTGPRPPRSVAAIAAVSFSLLLAIAGLAIVGRNTWRSYQRAQAALGVAHRYLTLMSSGQCAAAQQLTTFAGSPQYCASAGENLSNLRVACEHAETNADVHRIKCDVQSTSAHRSVVVLVAERDGIFLVIDEKPDTDESFGPP